MSVSDHHSTGRAQKLGFTQWPAAKGLDDEPAWSSRWQEAFTVGLRPVCKGYSRNDLLADRTCVLHPPTHLHDAFSSRQVAPTLPGGLQMNHASRMPITLPLSQQAKLLRTW